MSGAPQLNCFSLHIIINIPHPWSTPEYSLSSSKTFSGVSLAPQLYSLCLHIALNTLVNVNSPFLGVQLRIFSCLQPLEASAVPQLNSLSLYISLNAPHPWSAAKYLLLSSKATNGVSCTSSYGLCLYITLIYLFNANTTSFRVQPSIFSCLQLSAVSVVPHRIVCVCISLSTLYATLIPHPLGTAKYLFLAIQKQWWSHLHHSCIVWVYISFSTSYLTLLPHSLGEQPIIPPQWKC